MLQRLYKLIIFLKFYLFFIIENSIFFPNSQWYYWWLKSMKYNETLYLTSFCSQCLYFTSEKYIKVTITSHEYYVKKIQNKLFIHRKYIEMMFCSYYNLFQQNRSSSPSDSKYLDNHFSITLMKYFFKIFWEILQSIQ